MLIWPRSPFRLRVYSSPFEFVYSAGLEKLPGLAVAADKNANKASQFASAVAGGSGSEGLAFSGPYVEAHLDHSGAVVVLGHRYAITHGGTCSRWPGSATSGSRKSSSSLRSLLRFPMGF